MNELVDGQFDFENNSEIVVLSRKQSHKNENAQKVLQHTYKQKISML